MPDNEQNLVVPADDSLESPSPSAGQAAGAPAAPLPPHEPKRGGIIARLRTKTNIYLVVFGLLLAGTSLTIYLAVRGSQPKAKVNNVSSLTDQQLSALKGNTTLVGDAKQTLDVQSNSIFEGQILVRGDLNVAGAIKVGGGLSLNSITVGGAGSFGQLGINGGLNIGGDEILQGGLTIQKSLTVGGNASFGSLSVSTLSVSSLQLKNDLIISRHIITSGGGPGRSNGTALGSGGTASVSGSDTAGTVNINTGGSPPAGCFVTINFNQHYATTPHVIISPSNSSAAGLQYYVNRGTTNFSICTAIAPSGGTNYSFDYVVLN